MKILIADDDTTSRLLLGATLKKLGHEVTAVEDGRLGLQAWREGRHSVVISDWMMPELDGLELCSLIRTEPALHYTYLILLTSLAGKGRYLDGMQAGADDFINKPYDEESLAARLHVAERILALHESLRAAATYDRLTGLWNRAAILDHLEQALEPRADATGQVGIILVDLDRFKVINDTWGHAAGDSVLQEASSRMQACLEPNQKIGRYGGEEFLVVATDANARLIEALAETLRTAVGATPVQAAKGPLVVTVSLGAALATPETNQGLSTLVATADDALYRAKRAGRDRVVVAAPSR